eukprot:3821459-Amphidinium_carterae.1
MSGAHVRSQSKNNARAKFSCRSAIAKQVKTKDRGKGAWREHHHRVATRCFRLAAAGAAAGYAAGYAASAAFAAVAGSNQSTTMNFMLIVMDGFTIMCTLGIIHRAIRVLKWIQRSLMVIQALK